MLIGTSHLSFPDFLKSSPNFSPSSVILMVSWPLSLTNLSILLLFSVSPITSKTSPGFIDESKSLWRIKKTYKQDAGDCAQCLSFWGKLDKDKENHIKELRELIKEYIT